MPTKTRGDSPAPSVPAAPRASILIALFGLTTGATNAVSFMRLGHVFASVMTGNMVLLGISAGQRDASLAARVGIAFAAYVVGAFVGARICGAPDSMHCWMPRAMMALALEIVLFAGFAAAWMASDGHPRGGLQLGLLPVIVIAMALQASISRSMPARTPSTTYVTGTLTSAIADLVGGSSLKEEQRRLGAMAALIAGACCCAILVVEEPLSPPFLMLVLLATAFALVSGR